MAEFVLYVVGEPDGAGQYDRVTYYHDSTTRSDDIRREFGFPRKPRTEIAEPYPAVLGTYCRENGELTTVYRDPDLIFRSKLEFRTDLVACPVPAPPTGGGGGTGGGGTTPTDPQTTTIDPGNDPDAGAGWRLLLRLWRPAKSGDLDVWSYRDRYWNPTTRLEETVFSTQTFDQAGPDYSRPITEVIDRWCIARGEAPFTEVRVTHDGSGNADLTNVDNVAACTLPPCGLALTIGSLTNAGDGRGAVELLATGNTGPVGFTLGSPANTPQPTGQFERLPAGRYVGYGQETRDGGCVASLAFRITAAYGPRYHLYYADFAGTRCDLWLDMRGYTGPTDEVRGAGSNPVRISYPAGGPHVMDTPLKGSAIDVDFLIEPGGPEMLDTYASDERYIRIRHVREGKTHYSYVLPEQFSAPHLAPPYTFSLRGTDGLGALAGVKFTDPAGNRLTGQWSALQVILYCLNRLDFDLPLYILDTLYPEGASLSETPYAQFSVDVESYQTDKGEPWDCEQVLRALLETRAARLYQDADSGCWRLERLADLLPEPQQYLAYSPEGGRLPDPTPALRLATIQLPTEGRPHWQDGTQLRGLLPAVSRVVVEAKPGELVNLLARATRWAEEDFTESGRPIGWSGTAPVTRIAPARKSDPALLVLQGAPAGTAQAQALYIQTPATVPLVSQPNPSIGPLTLTVTATVRAVGGTPPEPLTFAQTPRLMVGIRQGTSWLAAGGGTSETQPLLYPVTFTRIGEEVTAELPGFFKPGLTPAPVVVRLYQVIAVGTEARYDVELKQVALQYRAGPQAAEQYEDITRYESDAFFTREDLLDLFHTDTPAARLKGTLLGPTGLPTARWFTAAYPLVLLPFAVYLVQARAGWQGSAAQTLTGTVSGRLNPGALLTDPQEATPRVYLLTDTIHNEADHTTELTAVALNTLTPPGMVLELPEGVLLMEDGRPTMTQDGHFFILENA